jgi:hypothetical protein
MCNNEIEDVINHKNKCINLNLHIMPLHLILFPYYIIHNSIN